MDFGVAVGAEKHALVDLGEHRFPSAIDPIGGEPERLFDGIAVMQVESGRDVSEPTSRAPAAELRDHAALRLTPQVNDRVGRRSPFHCVPLAVAVCANEITFRCFFPKTRKRPIERSDPEVFRRWISMVELKGRRTRTIAAIDAASAMFGNQLVLSRAPALLQRASKLFATAFGVLTNAFWSSALRYRRP
ncbi:MAG TPA: hypothetical protein VIA63_04625 [Candidatus Limnocylindria bacterium]